MVRVCMVLLSYKIVQAVIQPVTEKRLLEGMDAMTQGVGMLLHVLVGCVFWIECVYAIAYFADGGDMSNI